MATAHLLAHSTVRGVSILPLPPLPQGLFAFCAFLFTTPTLVLEVYGATGPELVKELRDAAVILRRLSHVLRPPLPDRRTPGEYWMWEGVLSLHIFLSHFTDWFEKRGYTYGDITEEGFEEKHKASKGAAHRQRMRLLFALQDLAVVDLLDINDRSLHDPIRFKV